LLIAKATRLSEKQALLEHEGLNPALAKSRHVDLLVTGIENSLWLGERFAQDLEGLMPMLNVKTLSANSVLQHLQHDLPALNFARQSIVLVLTHSGQTFASRQVAEACDLLVRQGVIQDVFLVIGEPAAGVPSSGVNPLGLSAGVAGAERPHLRRSAQRLTLQRVGRPVSLVRVPPQPDEPCPSNSLTRLPWPRYSMAAVPGS
jgi:hypothetical protein